MRFRLRVPAENGQPHPEFEIMPSAGIVLPRGKQEVRASRQTLLIACTLN